MSKRKLPCCKRNESKRQKDDRGICEYCECTFRKEQSVEDHVRAVHKCKKCLVIVLTEEERLQHTILHKQEEEERKERDRKEKEMDDAFMANFVIPKKLSECDPETAEVNDFYYVFEKYHEHIGREELVYFVNNMELDIASHKEFIDEDDVIHLLENGTISKEDLFNWITRSHPFYYDCKQLILYSADNGYEVESEWVAHLIENDEFIEHIKAKCEFTFDNIYDAHDYFDFDEDGGQQKAFYEQVHKHFPDPNFVEPPKFEPVPNQHVEDYLHNRYFYDEEEDELSIVVGDYKNERNIYIGKCNPMMEMELEDLIRQYQEAFNEYKKANQRVSELFDEVEEVKDEGGTWDPVREDYVYDKKKQNVLDNLYDNIHKIELPERNECANTVAHLYFVISKK